ncbi:nuclear transport factor 2 family protein [Marinomonas sp. PE14-40]|uniref:nuclear transport factor 2 family protein n=1 Tax=Marinomonas sp. PE14-40 TaxID=3060621 RepID=UPI003F6815D5
MANTLWLDNFITTYSKLGINNLHLLKEIYHQDVQFVDPMHQLKGLDTLLNYFDELYTQVSHCQFVVEEVLEADSEAAIYWTMTFCHKKLNKQQPIKVQGHSHIKSQDDKVIFHRDYLDLGAMLYEQIPLLGALIKSIKFRASQA